MKHVMFQLNYDIIILMILATQIYDAIATVIPLDAAAAAAMVDHSLSSSSSLSSLSLLLSYNELPLLKLLSATAAPP